VDFSARVVSSASTFRHVYLVYMAAWLNWCRRRDTAILSVTHASLVSSALALEYRSMATLHWHGRQVLSQVTYVVKYLGTGNKAQRVVCLLFSMSRLRSLWSLPPLLACHFTSSRRSPYVYTSPPVQGMHACVRVGAPAISSYASVAKQKRNEIPLSTNNNPLIQCLLTVTEKIQK